MGKFDDDIYYGLGRPAVAKTLNDMLFDDSTSNKKYNRTITAALTPDMYQAMQDLVAHRDLPFQGNMSAAVRHALGVFIEGTELFLEEDGRTIFRSLLQQQRRMTRERIIVTIDELIDQQVDTLRFWSARGKWNEVVRGIEVFVAEVSDYPVAEWREHAALMWLQNPGLRALLRSWQSVMKDDQPSAWRSIEKAWKKMEEMAGA